MRVILQVTGSTPCKKSHFSWLIFFQALLAFHLQTCLLLSLHLQSLRKTRQVEDYSDDDVDVTPIIVDAPPPGVNFTDCVTDVETGDCCIDLVSKH